MDRPHQNSHDKGNGPDGGHHEKGVRIRGQRFGKGPLTGDGGFSKPQFAANHIHAAVVVVVVVRGGLKEETLSSFVKRMSGITRRLDIVSVQCRRRRRRRRRRIPEQTVLVRSVIIVVVLAVQHESHRLSLGRLQYQRSSQGIELGLQLVHRRLLEGVALFQFFHFGQQADDRMPQGIVFGEQGMAFGSGVVVTVVVDASGRRLGRRWKGIVRYESVGRTGQFPVVDGHPFWHNISLVGILRRMPSQALDDSPNPIHLGPMANPVVPKTTSSYCWGQS